MSVIWLCMTFQDPLKNGVLVVQTLRNNMMASTLLATTAITLSSIIGVFVSSTSTVSNASFKLVYGNKSEIMSSIKYFALILCFLVAFLCNVQSIRYYAHVSFLATLPTSQGKKEAMEYAARSLNRGSFFWSLGLRAFYLSFPLFLWIFGPIPMFGCSCLMSIVLYFLDTTNSFTRHLHCESFKHSDNSGMLPNVVMNDIWRTSQVPSIHHIIAQEDYCFFILQCTFCTMVISTISCIKLEFEWKR